MEARVASGTYLVTSSVTQTGEERGELLSYRSSGVFLENNLLELGSRGDLIGKKKKKVSLCSGVPPLLHDCGAYPSLVAHQTLRGGINRMEDHQFGDTSGTYKSG